MTRTAFLFIVLASTALPLIGHAQVYRCTTAGRTIYQQQPCADTGTSGKEVRIQPNAPSTGAAAPVLTPAPDAAKAPSVETSVPPSGPPPKSPLEVLADQCLDWYRPRLRDPRAAYQRGASLEKGVLSLTIYATNAFGGYVERPGACEFRGSRLDENWTKIQADRLGW